MEEAETGPFFNKVLIVSYSAGRSHSFSHCDSCVRYGGKIGVEGGILG